jgi:hypothetical protein
MQTSSSVDYGYLRKLVFGLSQNVLDPSRDYLFDTRLTRLLRNQGMTRLEELVQHLKENKNPAPGALHRRGHDHQRNQLLPRWPPLRAVAHRVAAQAHRVSPAPAQPSLVERGLLHRPGGLQPGHASSSNTFPSLPAGISASRARTSALKWWRRRRPAAITASR